MSTAAHGEAWGEAIAEENRRGWGAAARPWARRARGAATFAWKWSAGALLCMGLFSSIIVVGWVYRVMQRSAVKAWHKRSGLRGEGVDFQAFVSDDAETAGLKRWPNWILAPDAWRLLRGERAVRRLPRALTGSLWANVTTGIGAAFNTWVLTLPGCAIMYFSWWGGWNNSFNKGYEQAAVGPVLGLLGAGLFIAAMFYLPIAQARQAATGEWRRFYDFSLVWRVIRRRWWACAALAAAYALCSVIVVMILKTAPVGFDRIEGYEQMTDAEVLANLQLYFLGSCFVVIAMYLLLRLMAVRTYARGLLAVLRTGDVKADHLGAFERRTLERLNLLSEPEPNDRHPVLRTAGALTHGTLVAASFLVMALIWFTFVSQIYVSEFLNYHGPQGWLNQPLVQLPWFSYIPPGLRG